MKTLHKDDGKIRIFAGGKTYVDVHYGDIPNKDVIHEPSIIVKSRGNIEFEYYDKPFSHKNEFWSYYSDSDDINIKYIHYYLVKHTAHFQHLANIMQMPQIAIPVTDNYKVPVPSLPVQEAIVDILDRFEAIVHDIQDGLPAEIALRQKQYEYYRDKLLTFEPLETETKAA